MARNGLRGIDGKMDVLIVDGQRDRVSRLVELLRDELGPRWIRVARDGTEALKLFRRRIPDLIIMGTVMPRMDGLTTLRVLRACRPTPVLVLAEESEVESVLDALALGAVGYLSLDEHLARGPEDLIERIRAAIDRRAGIVNLFLDHLPGEPPGVLMGVPIDGIAELAEHFRTGVSTDVAVLAVLEAPGWMIRPIARRLHHSTPWRVLAAAPGDRLIAGHAMLASVDSPLMPDPQDPRGRLVRTGPWPSVARGIGDLARSRSGDVERPGAPWPAAPGTGELEEVA